MGEHVENLKAARGRLVAIRRSSAAEAKGSLEAVHLERLVEAQSMIDAIDKAIDDEKGNSSTYQISELNI